MPEFFGLYDFFQNRSYYVKIKHTKSKSGIGGLKSTLFHGEESAESFGENEVGQLNF